MLDWSIWPQWVARFPVYQALLHANQGSLVHMMPTVMAGIHAIGAPPAIGYGIQLTLSCAVVVLVWDAWRRGITDQAIALVAIGSIIVTPYAMIYDMPMVAAGIAIHWKARVDADEPVAPLEIGLVIALAICVLTMTSHSLPFVAAILMVLLFLSVASVFSRAGQSMPKLSVAPPAAR